jgi:hypothetical protein
MTAEVPQFPQRRSPRRRLVGRLMALLTVALIVGGCRLDVVTEVTFGADGSGELSVAVRIDGATLRQLDELGVDPGLDVALVLDASRGWRAERLVDPDGGLILTHRRDFTDGAELVQLLEELSAGLAAQDPALRFDVDVVTDRRGALQLTGSGGVSPPATLGVLRDGEPVGPSGAALARLTRDAVRARFIVNVAGEVLAHDADRVEGRRVEWALPVGEQRALTLRSDGVGWWRRLPLAVWALGVLGGGLTGAFWARGRRAQRREQGPTEE